MYHWNQASDTNMPNWDRRSDGGSIEMLLLLVLSTFMPPIRAPFGDSARGFGGIGPTA